MSLPKLAFLGPLGTYSHQSASDNFGQNVEYVEKPTIKDVFEAVSEEIPYAVIPIENSTYGQVIDTYDCLRLPVAGSSLFVKGEITSSIQHCLVVRKGVQPEDIKKILSHEQALGQCSGFLSEHFPGVRIQKTASTALAAQMLLSDDDQDGERAAICSSLCTTLFDGLEVMHHGIQDRELNFTRFFVLANSLDVIPPLLPREPRLRRALVRVSKGSSETQSESITSKRPLHLAISTLLTTFGVPVIRVDRRPSIGGIPFDDVYFVEVDELGMLPEPGDDTNRRAEDGRWMRIVEKGVQRLRVAGLQGAIIGIW